MHKRIGVSLTRVGWHRWPNARAPREYLSSLHRHLFHISVEITVRHDDREVEFHDLRDLISTWWGAETQQTDRGSCEHIATELLDTIIRTLPGRFPSVQISEDGEAWARVQDH